MWILKAGRHLAYKNNLHRALARLIDEVDLTSADTHGEICNYLFKRADDLYAQHPRCRGPRIYIARRGHDNLFFVRIGSDDAGSIMQVASRISEGILHFVIK